MLIRTWSCEWPARPWRLCSEAGLGVGVPRPSRPGGSSIIINFARLDGLPYLQALLSDHFEIPSSEPGPDLAAAALPDCHWQLEQGPSRWGLVKPASLQGSDHYEIQGGALLLRAWPSCVGDLRLELATQPRTSEIKIHKESLPCFHLWIRLWKEISCIDNSSAWFHMWNHRSKLILIPIGAA